MASPNIGDSGHTWLKDHESLELHTPSTDNTDQRGQPELYLALEPTQNPHPDTSDAINRNSDL